MVGATTDRGWFLIGIGDLLTVCVTLVGVGYLFAASPDSRCWFVTSSAG